MPRESFNRQPNSSSSGERIQSPEESAVTKEATMENPQAALERLKEENEELQRDLARVESKLKESLAAHNATSNRYAMVCSKLLDKKIQIDRMESNLLMIYSHLASEIKHTHLRLAGVTGMFGIDKKKLTIMDKFFADVKDTFSKLQKIHSESNWKSE